MKRMLNNCLASPLQQRMMARLRPFFERQRPKTCLALAIPLALAVALLAPSAAQAQQLIVNPGFEDNPPPNFGNNIGWSIAPWTLGSGNRSNVVKVDGPGGFDYLTLGPESDATAPGAGIDQHYLDIAVGSNDFYQAFTVPVCANGSTTPNATYVTSGAFSTRDNLAGTGSIAIREGVGPSGVLVAGSENVVSLPAGTTLTGGWSVVGSTVPLTAGQTYSFVVAMDNNVNFDNGTVTFNGLQCPAIQVNKSTTSTPTQSGDTLVYTFEVINVSTPSALEISALTINDANCAAAPSLVSATVTPDTTLQAGETQVYSCLSVPVTQAQVDARAVTNTVTVDGIPSDGELVPASDTVTTPIVANILADDDDFTGTPIPGPAGGPAGNVLTNDQLDGAVPVAADVVITVLSAGSLTGVTISPDGTLNVPPGAPSGSYDVQYQICDALAPANCADATASVFVSASSLPIFSCGNEFYEVITGQLAVLDPLTGTYTPIGPLQASYNGISYNPVDNYLYGFLQAGLMSERLIRIGSNGVIENVPTVDAYVSAPNGAFDPASNVLYSRVLAGTLQGVNVLTGSVTSVALSPPTPPLFDLVFFGGSLFGMSDGALVIINPTTGSTTSVPVPGTIAGSYGAGWSISDGRVFFSNNTTGQIFEIGDPLGTPVVLSVTNAAISSNHDGANCYFGGSPLLRPELQLTKSLTGITDNGDGITPNLGDTLNFAFTVTNSGQIEINNLTITDPTATVSGGPLATLAVGATDSTTFTATHVITAADIIAGGYENSATVNGVTLSGTPVSDVSDAGTDSSGAVIPSPETTETPDLSGGTDGDLTNDPTVFAFSVIVAEDDDFTANPVRGPIGGIAGNVLDDNGSGEDTLRGISIDPALTTITVTDPDGLAGVGIADDGTLTVPPGTAPGTYQVVYEICEDANPGNCDTAIATVVVIEPVILADDDDFSAAPVNGFTGGVAGNAYTGDTLDGVQVTPAEVTSTVTSPATPIGGGPVPTLSTSGPTEGQVTVPAGTPAGTYTIGYELCEAAEPTNCDDAVITVEVAPPVIDAVNNSFPAISGLNGGSTASVLDNDRLNGAPFAPSAVVLTPGALPVSPAVGSITMNPDGTITVAPGTTAGSYSYPYEICEVLNPTNCDTAIATVVVGQPIVDARPEPVPSVNGASPPVGPIMNVLTADRIGGTQATPANVSITLISIETDTGAPYPAITLDPLTGDVTMTGPAAGAVVEVTYQICDIANPANCDTQTETIAVLPLILEALPEPYDPINGYVGGTLTVGGAPASIIGSDIVDSGPATLAPGNPNSVVIPAPVPGDYTDLATGTPVTFLTLDPSTGVVTVSPGAPAGTYGIFYEICDPLDPSRCDGITETITVEAAPIDAVDDAPAPVNGAAGATIPTVLGNDTLDGAPVDPADVTLTPGPAPTPAAGSITMDPATGEIVVAPGTTAGSYTYAYEICEVLNPANCDTAEVTIVVEAAPIDAVDDDFSATPIDPVTGGTAGNLLGNDTLNTDPVDPADITLVVTDAGGLVGVTVSAAGDLIIPPGAAAGTYLIDYEICEVLNPTNCDIATATVVVAGPAGTNLVDDVSAGNIPGTPVTVAVLGNDNDPFDTFDRSTLIIVGTANPGDPLVVPGEGTWTVDLGSGTITFTPEAGFTGNPTPITYQVTDIFGNLLSPAQVVILYEYVAAFICSDVIGKVFDDKNQDGQQDDGEPGIAAVRLATVNGDIITTDEYGRYSVPCAAIPQDIGSTFLLKLDPRSLPTGYRLTTENPKTVRLTQGSMRRMNFGVSLSNLVQVDLTGEAFDEKGAIGKDLEQGLNALVSTVARKPSVVRLSYFADGESAELAKDRLDLVEDRLRDLWRGRGKYQLNLEKTVVERE